MIRNAILAIILMILALAFLVLKQTLLARPTGTYETTIIDKRTQDTVIYTGIFVPMKIHILETTELNQIQVKKPVYDRINVGDRVTVTRYSNGQHRLKS